MSRDRALVEKWKITQGPRVKSLATQIFEYIIYALLDTKSVVAIERNNENNHLIIQVNQKSFDVTEILKSSPDFEQIILGPEQLKAYVEFCKSIKKYEAPSWFNYHRELDPAEYSALRAWTGGYYTRINPLLRYAEYPHDGYGFPFPGQKIKYMLLTISVAVHGLKHFKSYQPVQKSYRSEEFFSQIKIREEGVNQKKLVVHPGFTAASANFFIKRFGSIKTTITQPSSINPIGKRISSLSKSSCLFQDPDGEVLFPPNTEFQYQKIDGSHWEAEPVRSAEPNTLQYNHPFSKEELAEIFLDKAKIRINILLTDVQLQMAQNSPNPLQRFFKFSDSTLEKQIMHGTINNLIELATDATVQSEKLDKLLQLIDLNIAKVKSQPERLHKVLLSTKETVLTIRSELNLLPQRSLAPQILAN